jgi:MoaA/NifB/PqqE/SkfB family radical SAM enzyme
MTRCSTWNEKLRIRYKLASLKAVAAAHILGKNTPLTATISLTGQCNYQCAYCRLWQQKKDQMSTKQILSLITGLTRMGTQRVGFTQDEPLLHRDIGEIIGFCKDKGLFVTLGTNGSLVKERINQLRGIDVMNLSLDGPPEIHDHQRVPGAHRNVMHAIRTAREKEIQVWTTTVLTKHNLASLDYILETAGEMDFKTAFQVLYHSPDVAGDTSHLLPSARDYQNALRRIIEKKRRGAPIINSYGMLNFLYHWPEYRDVFFDPEKDHKQRLRCWAGRLFLHVECNGEVYPCSQLLGNPLAFPNASLESTCENARSDACTYCCLGADYIEYNLLFALRPGAIWNALKI